MDKYETPILELMRFGNVDIVTGSLNPEPGTETPPIGGDGAWEL